jgi:hypothetical protein
MIGKGVMAFVIKLKGPDGTPPARSPVGLSVERGRYLATGRITRWTEDQFVARFRQGRLLEDSPMPWGALRNMSEDDLRSIYRYLRTVKAVRNETGESKQLKK